FEILYVLLSDQPVLQPHARLFQRFVALDEKEATEIVKIAGKSDSIDNVFSDLVIPALSLLSADCHRSGDDHSRESLAARMVARLLEPEPADALQSRNGEARRDSGETQSPSSAIILPVHGALDELS